MNHPSSHRATVLLILFLAVFAVSGMALSPVSPPEKPVDRDAAVRTVTRYIEACRDGNWDAALGLLETVGGRMHLLRLMRFVRGTLIKGPLFTKAYEFRIIGTEPGPDRSILVKVREVIRFDKLAPGEPVPPAARQLESTHTFEVVSRYGGTLTLALTPRGEFLERLRATNRAIQGGTIKEDTPEFVAAIAPIFLPGIALAGLAESPPEVVEQMATTVEASHRKSLLVRCQAHLRLLSRALEQWNFDEGRYPDSLASLVTGSQQMKTSYLRGPLPVCPASNKPYAYAWDPARGDYVIRCVGDPHGLGEGLPAFTSREGLLPKR